MAPALDVAVDDQASVTCGLDQRSSGCYTGNVINRRRLHKDLPYGKGK